MSQTVESLRKSGNKVCVTHLRWVPELSEFSLDTLTSLGLPLPEAGKLLSRYEADKIGYSWLPDPRGGMTVVELTKPDGTNSIGVTVCSDNDNFNHKLGTRQALNRALGVEPPLKFNKASANELLEMIVDSVLNSFVD